MPRKTILRCTAGLVAAAVLFSVVCVARPKRPRQNKPVFRPPFVLRLQTGKGRYYEQKFDRVPYVTSDDVYLFSGDGFGISASVADGQISRITYQPSAAKADVEFSFFQQRGAGGFVMMLIIQSRLRHKLFLDALMTVPGRAGIFKTDILPIPPGLTDYESWPHPIVQLVLKNFRFTAKEPEVRPRVNSTPKVAMKRSTGGG